MILERLIGDKAGCLDGSGYVRIRIGSKKLKAHHLAWLYMTGSWPTMDIDHIDGSKSNNAWRNLRLADDAINRQNIWKANRDSSTGVRHVHRVGSRFRVSIKADGRRYNLGRFATLEEAAQVATEAKPRLQRGAAHGRR